MSASAQLALDPAFTSYMQRWQHSGMRVTELQCPCCGHSYDYPLVPGTDSAMVCPVLSCRQLFFRITSADGMEPGYLPNPSTETAQ